MAHTLWLAGTALDRAELRDLAIEAVKGVLRRPPALRQTDSPTFCHGVAGLLQIALRLAVTSGDPELPAGVLALVEQLLDQYDPGSLLGYLSRQPDGSLIDSLGLLDGVAGIGHTLLAAARRSSRRGTARFCSPRA